MKNPLLYNSYVKCLSLGSVPNGNNFIEVIKYKGEYFFIDHSDGDDYDLIDFYELINEYDWSDEDWVELKNLLKEDI